MRVAGVDVGSNSFLLCIVDLAASPERLLLDRADITRLGEGVDRTAQISAAAIARGVAMLQEYRRLTDSHGVVAVRAAGTAALRDATNRDEFLAAVAAATGWQVDVISGEREAELTYADVAVTHGQPGQPLALLDIGGGSSELVLGRDGRIGSRRSIQIGSRRCHERAAPGDPPSPADLLRLAAVADAALADIEPLAPGSLVGSGGTITTLAAVQLGLPVYDAAAVAAVTLTVADIDALVARLAALPWRQRQMVPGLEAERADIIVAGAVLTARWLRRLGAPAIGVAVGGLRRALARLAGAPADA
ncbi:MAG: hypothetical protein IT204_15235 [Fimbriimonadaceae bacterium]|nr:hypothetical protein [Fimbriimonadaceae bacterium]